MTERGRVWEGGYPECTSNASRLLPKSISILQEFSCNALRMPLESFAVHSKYCFMFFFTRDTRMKYTCDLETNHKCCILLKTITHIYTVQQGIYKTKLRCAWNGNERGWVECS